MRAKIEVEVITKKEYQRIGKAMHLLYGIINTNFGLSLIATYNGKICFFGFIDNDEENVIEELKAAWHFSQLERNDIAIAQVYKFPIRSILLKGSDFQIKVWTELTFIPPGSTTSYEDIARKLGNTKAVRAVANTIAANNISVLIPCHRVIRKSGNMGGYRWGIERKRSIIKSEL